MTMPRLEDLMTFPARFTYRVIAEALPEIATTCREALRTAVGREVDGLETRPSAHGRWMAVHLTVEVQTADEVRDGYRLLGAVQGVKMIL